MINARKTDYSYYTFEGKDSYGQPKLSEEVKGTVKMAIFVASQSVQDSVLYSGAEYIGLTNDEVTDKYVIQYGDSKLKVMYVTPGRNNQVFMARM